MSATGLKNKVADFKKRLPSVDVALFELVTEHYHLERMAE
jgi:hypothetical protein